MKDFQLLIILWSLQVLNREARAESKSWPNGLVNGLRIPGRVSSVRKTSLNSFDQINGLKDQSLTYISSSYGHWDYDVGQV